ncbi:MAG: hypothetical protein OEM49_08075 [Myxococcales bacterium]|nr:hypothetical protein [Myxococcales bacterium]
MEDNAWIFQTVAGVFYVMAGIPLLRLASRSGQAPERILGTTFLLMGISYGFYQAPIIFASLVPHEVPLTVVGRLAYDASVVMIAFFTRGVFRNREAWATGLVCASVVLLVAGLVVSVGYGDWNGYAPLANPGYWLEFTGQVIPCTWIAIEGFLQHRKLQKRVHFGLSDPAVCNRLLLWSLFGAMQLATIVVLVKMNLEYEARGVFSVAMDALEGLFEMLTILMIWLAFFPPRFYRSWVSGRNRTQYAGTD